MEKDINYLMQNTVREYIKENDILYPWARKFNIAKICLKLIYRSLV